MTDLSELHAAARQQLANLLQNAIRHNAQPEFRPIQCFRSKQRLDDPPSDISLLTSSVLLNHSRRAASNAESVRFYVVISGYPSDCLDFIENFPARMTFPPPSATISSEEDTAAGTLGTPSGGKS